MWIVRQKRRRKQRISPLVRVQCPGYRRPYFPRAEHFATLCLKGNGASVSRLNQHARPWLAALLLAWSIGAQAADEPTAPANPSIAPAGWIWESRLPPAASTAVAETPAHTYFRGMIRIERPQAAQLEVSAQGRFTLYLNGARLGAGEGWSTAAWLAVPELAAGEHCLAVRVSSPRALPAADSAAPGIAAPPGVAAPFPAALHVRLREKLSAPLAPEKGSLPLGTNPAWRCSTELVERWTETAFDDSRWSPVQNGGDFSPAERLAWLSTADAAPAIAQALLRQTSSLSHDERFALRELDQRLLAQQTPVADPLLIAVYSSLAVDGDERSLAHLHQVFETYPERRHVVALALARYALAHRRRQADWRLLVRALPLVEGDLAREVIAAMVRFPDRATRARWLRQALLQGLQLGENGGRDAFELLEHWAADSIFQADDDWPSRVAAAQNWFARRYPDQPPPHLPAEDVAARYRYEPLLEWLRESPPGDLARGREVLRKARCHLCHRHENQGEPLGPELTGLGSRLQLKEMVYATIFPSEWVADEYTAYAIETTDGRILTGLVGRQGNDSLMILQPDGQKASIPQKSVKRSAVQRLSIMPHNMLESLSEQEVLDLFTLLRRRATAD